MRLRKLLRKIHRWVGLLSALWLLQLATTGLLLQHADTLKLTSSFVKSPTILQWFDYGHRQQAWDVAGEVVYQIDDEVKINEAIINIAEPLVGAVKLNKQWVLATSNQLRWINPKGEIINQIDDFDGVPTPIEQVVIDLQTVFLQSGGVWYQVLTDLTFEPSISPTTIKNQPRALLATEKENLFRELLGQKLSYDKVIHGIHSGIKSSSWLNTLSALALLYLCFSGIYLFFKTPKKKSK